MLEEQQDIEDIYRVLEDAGVSNINVDQEVNIDLAEHEGNPPEKFKSFKKGLQ